MMTDDRTAIWQEYVFNKIREKRLANGFSQAQLSRAVGGGLTPARVSDIERGSYDVRIGTLFNIIDALGLNLQDFFADSPRARVKTKKD